MEPATLPQAPERLDANQRAEPGGAVQQLACLVPSVGRLQIPGLNSWTREGRDLKAIPLRDTAAPIPSEIRLVVKVALTQGNEVKASLDIAITQPLNEMIIVRGEVCSQGFKDAELNGVGDWIWIRGAGIRRVQLHRLRRSGITRVPGLADGDMPTTRKLSRHKKLVTVVIYDNNRRDFTGQCSFLLAFDHESAFGSALIGGTSSL